MLRTIVSFVFAALASTLGPVLLVHAESQGSLGSTSQGNSTATIGVPNLILISGVADLNFGSYSGGSDPERNERVCVYTNNGTGNYKVKALGNYTEAGGDGTGFFARLGTFTATIPYAIQWNDEPQDGGQTLTAGSYLTGQSGANTSSTNCDGGNTANLRVSFTKDDILDDPAGVYTGVITVIVEPS